MEELLKVHKVSGVRQAEYKELNYEVEEDEVGETCGTNWGEEERV
jgi:hypothetical protein